MAVYDTTDHELLAFSDSIHDFSGKRCKIRQAEILEMLTKKIKIKHQIHGFKGDHIEESMMDYIFTKYDDLDYNTKSYIYKDSDLNSPPIEHYSFKQYIFSRNSIKTDLLKQFMFICFGKQIGFFIDCVQHNFCKEMIDIDVCYANLKKPNMKSFLSNDILCFSSIASYWDEASKDKTLSFDIHIDGMQIKGAVDDVHDIKYSYSEYIISINSDTIDIIYNDARIEYVKDELRNENLTRKTVLDLCNLLKTKCKLNGIKQILSGKTIAQAFENGDTQKLLLDIKRSLDYGQIAYVNKCNILKSTNKIKIHEKDVETKDIVDRKFVLITYDKLCFMKAIVSNCPCVFMKFLTLENQYEYTCFNPTPVMVETFIESWQRKLGYVLKRAEVCNALNTYINLDEILKVTNLQFFEQLSGLKDGKVIKCKQILILFCKMLYDCYKKEVATKTYIDIVTFISIYEKVTTFFTYIYEVKNDVDNAINVNEIALLPVPEEYTEFIKQLALLTPIADTISTNTVTYGRFKDRIINNDNIDEIIYEIGTLIDDNFSKSDPLKPVIEINKSYTDMTAFKLDIQGKLGLDETEKKYEKTPSILFDYSLLSQITILQDYVIDGNAKPYSFEQLYDSCHKQIRRINIRKSRPNTICVRNIASFVSLLKQDQIYHFMNMHVFYHIHDIIKSEQSFLNKYHIHDCDVDITLLEESTVSGGVKRKYDGKKENNGSDGSDGSEEGSEEGSETGRGINSESSYTLPVSKSDDGIKGMKCSECDSLSRMSLSSRTSSTMSDNLKRKCEEGIECASNRDAILLLETRMQQYIDGIPNINEKVKQRMMKANAFFKEFVQMYKVDVEFIEQINAADYYMSIDIFKTYFQIYISKSIGKKQKITDNVTNILLGIITFDKQDELDNLGIYHMTVIDYANYLYNHEAFNDDYGLELMSPTTNTGGCFKQQVPSFFKTPCTNIHAYSTGSKDCTFSCKPKLSYHKYYDKNATANNLCMRFMRFLKIKSRRRKLIKKIQ